MDEHINLAEPFFGTPYSQLQVVSIYQAGYLELPPTVAATDE